MGNIHYMKVIFMYLRFSHIYDFFNDYMGNGIQPCEYTKHMFFEIAVKNLNEIILKNICCLNTFNKHKVF